MGCSASKSSSSTHRGGAGHRKGKGVKSHKKGKKNAGSSSGNTNGDFSSLNPDASPPPLARAGGLKKGSKQRLLKRASGSGIGAGGLFHNPPSPRSSQKQQQRQQSHARSHRDSTTSPGTLKPDDRPTGGGGSKGSMGNNSDQEGCQPSFSDAKSTMSLGGGATLEFAERGALSEASVSNNRSVLLGAARGSVNPLLANRPVALTESPVAEPVAELPPLLSDDDEEDEGTMPHPFPVGNNRDTGLKLQNNQPHAQQQGQQPTASPISFEDSGLHVELVSTHGAGASSIGPGLSTSTIHNTAATSAAMPDFSVDLLTDDDDFDDGPGRRCSMQTSEASSASSVGQTYVRKTVDEVPKQSSVNKANPYSRANVRRHGAEDDLWVIVRNNVYDLTEFQHSHPGGNWPLLQVGGKDATKTFEAQHGVAYLQSMKDYMLGSVPADERL